MYKTDAKVAINLRLPGGHNGIAGHKGILISAANAAVREDLLADLL
jgi:hypothetical protein